MSSIYKKYLTTLGLVWAGCLLLFVFVYMLVLAPQSTARKDIQKKLVDEIQVYESAMAVAKEENQLQLKEQLAELQKELDGFVINFEDSANLVFDIGQIANEKAVNDFSIKTKDRKSGIALPQCGYIYENHIAIKFESGFNQFATLLNALERHWPVVFINKFSITRSRQDDINHPVTMDLAVFVKK